jgi:hypothetical protein
LGLVGPEMSRRVGEARLEADAWRGGCRMNSTWGAFGRRSACTPNEFGLGRPSANGRPAPTGEVSFASSEADAWRAAPWKADFNRREGLRPTVGMRRPGRVSSASAEADAWRAAPWKADFNRREGLRPAVGLRRPGRCLLRRRRPTPGARAPWKADFNRQERLQPRPLRDRGEGVRDGKLLLPNDRRCPRGTGSGRKPLLHKATTVGSRRQGLRCGKPFPQK